MGMPGPGGGPQGQGGPGQGLGILPPGPFWKNPDLIKLLGLTADQQKHMDEIVHQSRVELIHLKAALDEAQLNLEPVLNATPFDQAKALDAASKIIDLRSSLEKADAKMLLSLRNLLTPDQWTKLQADMHAHHGQGGPGSPDGKRNHRDFNGPNPNGPPPAGIEDNQ
jgi:Spy/CpxP family protein refolding chaperone